MKFGRNLAPALSTEETTQKQLPGLPQELWLEIFARASIGTLWNTRQVSRAWRRLTAHTVRFDILPSVTILSFDQPLSSRSMWGFFHRVSSTGFSENHDGDGRNDTIANKSAAANMSCAYFTLRNPWQKRRTAERVFAMLRPLYPVPGWPKIAVVNTADETEVGHITQVLFCYTAPLRNDVKLPIVSARRGCLSSIAAPLVACMPWLRGTDSAARTSRCPSTSWLWFWARPCASRAAVVGYGRRSSFSGRCACGRSTCSCCCGPCGRVNGAGISTGAHAGIGLLGRLCVSSRLCLGRDGFWWFPSFKNKKTLLGGLDRVPSSQGREYTV